MKHLFNACLALLLTAFTTFAPAQIKLTGYFIARSECQAFQSFRKQTNPGNVHTEIDRAYPLIGKNKADASHYLIRMRATPAQRWVAAGCGEHVVPVTDAAPQPSDSRISESGMETAASRNYVLAISWQAGFCETRPDKPECLSQHADRFDASHFSLHGLWPQPRSNIYCNVPSATVAIDKNSRWLALPALDLSTATRAQLNRVMPGSQSGLHRHEWVKHGTCFRESAEDYFRDSVRLMDELNASAVRDLFAGQIGKTVSAAQIRSAFNEAFGQGAGDRIAITCKRDGSRRLITEIRINLAGTPDDLSLDRSIATAPRAGSGSCPSGIVDSAGFQ